MPDWYVQRADKFRADLRQVVSDEQAVNVITALAVELIQDAHSHWNETRTRAQPAPRTLAEW